MLNNFDKIDMNAYQLMVKDLGKSVVEQYTGKKDNILVEGARTIEEGTIYYLKDSWIKKGDILKINDTQYLVMSTSSLFSNIINVGKIQKCDAKLLLKDTKGWAYNLPCVATKASISCSKNTVIDTSVDGKLTFITGFNKEIKKILSNDPYTAQFGSLWTIYSEIHNDGLMTLYAHTAKVNSDKNTKPEIIVERLNGNYAVDDEIKIIPYTHNQIDEDSTFIFRSNNTSIATVDEYGNAKFLKTGRVTFTVECQEYGLAYISPTIIVVA